MRVIFTNMGIEVSEYLEETDLEEHYLRVIYPTNFIDFEKVRMFSE